MNALLSLLSMLPGFEKELRLLPMLLRPGRVAVDVGASLGVYSLPMAMLVGASGAVIAFEPRTDAAARLRRIASILGLSALRVESAALGATASTSTLVVPRRRWLVPGRSFISSGALHTRLDDELVPGLEVRVPITTLDEQRIKLGRPIDFVKCDVEGAEHDVFTGGYRVLTEDRPVVLCEIEDRHTARYGRTTSDVIGLFQEHGYRQTPVGTGSPEDARNVLFVPTDRPPFAGRGPIPAPIPA